MKIFLHGYCKRPGYEGYLFLNHNASEKENDGRITKGVGMILSPEFAEAYTKAGAPTPITTPNSGENAGRFIGVPLMFQKYDDYGKRISGQLKIFFASIYSPVPLKEQREFNEVWIPLLEKKPNNYETLTGHDVNASVGIRESEEDPLKPTLGPFGKNHRNMKGTELLEILTLQKLKLINSFFEKDSYTTWKNPNNGSLHMLDIFTCSRKLHIQNNTRL